MRMLSRRDICMNIRCLTLISAMRIIPAQVNFKTGKIKILKGSKLHPWLVYLPLVQLHAGIAAFHILTRFRIQGIEATPSLTWDYLQIIGSQFGMLTFAANFYVWPEITEFIFNESIRKDCCNGRRPWNSYTYQDVLIMTLPICIFPLVSLTFLAITLMRPPYLSIWIELLVISMEAIFTFIWLSWAYVGVLIQLLFLNKISFILQHEMTKAA